MITTVRIQEIAPIDQEWYLLSDRNNFVDFDQTNIFCLTRIRGSSDKNEASVLLKLLQGFSKLRAKKEHCREHCINETSLQLNNVFKFKC